ncbi:Chromosome partitioning ATPase, ParA family [Haloferax volcanii]|nr:hypothetical protein [Haloferax alexandrinus]WEL28362.1 Chromosome partitioning ATPase, ParA family [Haloferax alexandrinus]
MSIPTTIALVGATGGAGTTRLSLELAAALATDGRDVAVLDAAFATQGLSDYVSGTLDPDATALVTDAADVPLESGWSRSRPTPRDASPSARPRPPSSGSRGR